MLEMHGPPSNIYMSNMNVYDKSEDKYLDSVDENKLNIFNIENVNKKEQVEETQMSRLIFEKNVNRN